MKQFLFWVALGFLALAIVLWMLGKFPDVFIALIISALTAGIGYIGPEAKDKRHDG